MSEDAQSIQIPWVSYKTSCHKETSPEKLRKTSLIENVFKKYLDNVLKENRRNPFIKIFLQPGLKLV